MIKREYYIIIIVSIATIMINIDASIIDISLPTIAKHFHVNTTQVSRVVMVYLLALISFSLISGSLSDTRGLKTIFITGSFIFIIGTLMSGLSGNINILNAFRFFQGIGGAMLMATYSGIIIRFLPSGLRAKAFGYMTAAGGIGYDIGPPLGGVFTRYFGWRSIFFINIPLGLIVIYMAYKILQDKPVEHISVKRFDIIGAVLSFLGLATLLYGLNMGQEYGWTSPVITGCIILSGFFIISFIIFELKSSAPILNLSLFKNLFFSLGLMATFIYMMVLDGYSFLLPFYFELVKGWTSEKSGLMFAILPVMTFILSPVSVYISDKVRPNYICIFSMVFLIGASIMFYFCNQYTSIYFLILSFIVFALGTGMFSTGGTNIVMSYARKGREGEITSLNSFCINLGSIFGVCIFETIFSYYHGYNTGKTHLELPVKLIVEGFQNAFIFGIVLCFIGLMASIVTRKSNVLTEFFSDPSGDEKT